MRRLALAACAAALLLLAACGSSGSGAGAGSTTAAGTSGQGPRITIKDFGYSGDLSVKPGAKVTVTNEDSTAHTLTDKKTHKFDTGNIDGNGGTGTFTAPTAPGTYPFGCSYHPEMKGTLTVKG